MDNLYSSRPFSPPGVPEAAHRFVAFAMACQMNVIQALVLAKAFRNQQSGLRIYDFSLCDAPEIVGFDADDVCSAVACLTTAGRLTCVDCDEMHHYNLINDGTWLGDVANSLATAAYEAYKA